MSDDSTTNVDVSWETLFDRAEGSTTDLATIEDELAARRGRTDE